MGQYNEYRRWLNEHMGYGSLYDYRAKEENVSTHVWYMVDRLLTMFEWSGLPDTIPQRMIELYHIINGNMIVTEVNGELYALTGGLGGEPDAYYQPTLYTVANPYLNLSKSYKIDTECVLCRNDSMMIGLIPLCVRNATGIVETELSLYIANINSRIIQLITASDDRTKAAGDEYIGKVEDGNLGIILDEAFCGGIKTSPYNNTSTRNITDLIELLQYSKASWYNELGLNANYNMKRESINSGESQLNNDALLPLVDNMLKCRKESAEKINAMYGTNISVRLSSAWKDVQERSEVENEKDKGQTETSTSDESAISVDGGGTMDN